MLSNSYARKRLAEIAARLTELEEVLKNLPEGKLSYSSSRGKTQYYQLIGIKNNPNYSRKYLGDKDREIAASLARKELIISEIKELEVEKFSITKMLSIQEKYINKELSSKTKVHGKDFSELLRSGASLDDINFWANAPCSSSAPNQEARRIRAIDGTLVRSKSEAEIISLLVKYNLPYRYECDLVFNERIIGCPDFTIMHPSTHEIIIWEHFGLLDNLYYVRRNIYKIQSYIEAGYYPMTNFIVTSETGERPFDITLADTLIRQFFLQ